MKFFLTFMNILYRSNFEIQEASREKKFHTFRKNFIEKKKSKKNSEINMKKETVLREGINQDSKTSSWRQESLTEEEKRIMMWIKETIKVVELYVENLKTGLKSYSDPIKQILKPPVASTVFRSMYEVNKYDIYCDEILKSI